MNDLDTPRQLKAPSLRPLLPAPDRDAPGSPPSGPPRQGGSGRRRLLGLGVFLLFTAALGLGVWRHYQQHRQVMDTAEQQASFVPSVRVEAVAQRLGRLHVTLPATTLAFEAANIFARASGYVSKRYVDIGDHVKAGQLLAEITAPEVEAQVAQFQNSLQQAQATVRQNEAQRASTDVTSRRISVLAKDSWAPQEQADTDRYNYQAQQHATTAAQYNAAAMEQQLKFVNQQKIYQQVVAPFDGVITQRNIDTGSLITADATGGTSMFSLQRGDVIRVWVYVPQDAAFGVKPGADAVLRVLAMPSLTFHGKVADRRCAAAGNADLADRGRRSQPGWRAAARGLLHRRTEDPTSFAGADCARLCDRLQPERHAGGSRRKRHCPFAQNRNHRRLRHRGRGQRGHQGR